MTRSEEGVFGLKVWKQLRFNTVSRCAFFCNEFLCFGLHQVPWNAAGQTSNISLIWPFVSLSAACLSQQRKPRGEQTLTRRRS